MDNKFSKSIEELEETLEKGRKMPIGTVSKGRKKVAEGKWVPVKDGKETGKQEKPEQDSENVKSDFVERVKHLPGGDSKASKETIDKFFEEIFPVKSPNDMFNKFMNFVSDYTHEEEFDILHALSSKKNQTMKDKFIITTMNRMARSHGDREKRLLFKYLYGKYKEFIS